MRKITSIVIAFALVLSINTTFASANDRDRTQYIKWIDGDYKVEKMFGLRGFDSGLIIVKENDKYGAIDKDGNEVVPCKYHYPMVFYGDLAKIKKREGKFLKYGYINDKGEEVIPVKYTRLGEFKDGVAVATQNGKSGYINKDGEVEIPFRYVEAEPFSEDLAVVRLFDENDESALDFKYFYIDKKGKTVVKGPFVIAESFSDGLAMVKKDYKSKIQYIDKIGKIVLNTSYRDAKSFSEGLAPVQKGDLLKGKWGFINKKGKEVIKPKYDGVENFHNGMAVVMLGDLYSKDVKYGLIDKAGKIVASIKYDKIRATENGFIIKKGNKYSYLHKNGIRTKLKYDDITMVNGRVGVSAAGIGSREAYLSLIDGATIMVREGEKTGYIDGNGKVIMPLSSYDGIIARDDKVALILKKTGNSVKFGYATENGKRVIIPTIFNLGSVYLDGMGIVEKDGKIGIIDEEVLFAENPAKVKNEKIEAIYSSMPVKLNGEKIENLEIYNLNGNNYFKLRDIALLSKNSKNEFSVDWNSAKKVIEIKKGGKYKVIGQELLGKGDGHSKEAVLSKARILLDNKFANIKAYSISDNNYYKLRDLSKVLGFEVGYDKKTRTVEISM